jgi:phage regulator Rha-like protein
LKFENEKGSKMYEVTKAWVDTLELNVETRVLANLALMLAARYDEKGETSTAGELRKTMNELRAALSAEPDFDPLENLLKH